MKPAADEEDAAAGGGVRAVERAIDILQSFSPEAPSLSVLELQKKTGLSRPTLYRLLHTLCAKGMVRAEGEPQRFALDHGAARLSQVWTMQLDVARLAQPIIAELRAATDETTALFLLREERQICALELTSPHALAMSRGLGEIGNIGQGASGKAILAHVEEAVALRLLAALPQPPAPETARAELTMIRSQGYAISLGEVFVGAVAIAAPIFDRNGGVIGSIGLFGPAARLPQARVADAIARVCAAAAALSRALGHAR